MGSQRRLLEFLSLLLPSVVFEEYLNNAGLQSTQHVFVVFNPAQTRLGNLSLERLRGRPILSLHFLEVARVRAEKGRSIVC